MAALQVWKTSTGKRGVQYNVPGTCVLRDRHGSSESPVRSCYVKVVSTATSTPNMVAFSTTAIDQAAAETQYTGEGCHS